MRKIEQQMIAAIKQAKNWESDNTLVHVDLDYDTTEVYLHGNQIAKVASNSVSFTLAGWNTQTTRSRVTAILKEFVHANARVYTQDGVAKYHDGTNSPVQSINDTQWVQA